MKDGWDLEVTIVDTNGNVIEDDTHVESKLKDVWQDFTSWITDVVWGAVDDAVTSALNMASSFVDWAKDKVSSMFSSVVNPIVDGLQDWADGIKNEMNNFFSKLSNWDDGDGDVDATMQAGTGLMMSFVGQQDKAEQVTDVLSEVMNYIKPFQKYLSPMGAMETLSNSLSDDFNSGVMSFVSDIKNTAVNNFEQALADMLEIIITPSFMESAGFDELANEGNIPDISISSFQNFVKEAGLNSDLVNTICGAFDKVDWSGIAEDTTNLVIIGVSLYLLFESIKTTIIGISPSVRSVADTVNSAIALIASLVSTSIDNILIGAYSACLGTITAFFGEIFSALCENIPAFLINLALLPGNIAAFGVSVAS